MENITRFFKKPAESFFLFGPRGTGKSTWARFCFKDALWIDLLAPDIFRSYSAKPERLRDVIGANPQKRVIVIDEIQKIPALLDMVHALMEEKRGWQFVLTGSSSRKLKRSGVDLLGGRAVLRTLHPFMAAELGDAFQFEKALRIGLVPLIWGSQNPSDVLQAYIALYIREEVQMEGFVRNIGNFSRFLEAVSFSHASIINVSNIARECEVERKVVEGYVGIIEDLLLSFRVPVFTKRVKRTVALHPKFYLFDAGVFRALRPGGPLDRPEEIEGCALEGLVAEHLRAWLAYRGTGNNLYFWRTRSGLEVDFIIYSPDAFWAIEVKNTGRVRPEDLRSLRAFKDEYPECKTILLYRGTERLMQHNVLCVPCEEFLKQLEPFKPLDAGL